MNNLCRFFVSLVLMKKNFYLLLFLGFSIAISAQEKAKKTSPFKPGEWLEYKLSYSGFLRAGTAELSLEKDTILGKEVLYGKGVGNSSTVIGWFFKVRDVYETYMDKQQIKPYYFKRNVYEGGYIIKRNTTFDYNKKIAKVEDFKYNTVNEYPFENVQDMLSAFYYLRTYNLDHLNKNDEINLTMFFDSKSYNFKLRFLEVEYLKTKWGKIKTYKLRPYVESGRVFKSNESVVIWITADENKIPIKLKASLAVGSIRAELASFKGLANSFKVIFD